MWNISLVLSLSFWVFASLLSLTLSCFLFAQSSLSACFLATRVSVLLVLVLGLVFFFCFPFLSKGQVFYGLS